MYENSREIFLLDLCIFAYQLHSQTLIWPMDPYYEQMSTLFGDGRNTFMKNVREKWFEDIHLGWKPDDWFEPIIADYTRVDPWKPSFTRPKPGQWILYNTPTEITSRIRTLKLAIRDRNQELIIGPALDHNPKPPAQATLEELTVVSGTDSKRNNLLYCFEGSTGTVDYSKSAAWSLMGFVLADCPSDKTEPYDVYIVFRGSRSGRLGSTLMRYSQNLVVNPDWATDLASITRSYSNESAICADANVCCGFAQSMKSMLPTIIMCLDDIHTGRGRPPRDIYVTGHSLGGALAVHFTSAILLGREEYYGSFGSGARMPPNLKTWPWRDIKLTTFGGPTVGAKDFQRIFDLTLPSTRIWLERDPIEEAASDVYDLVAKPLTLIKIPFLSQFVSGLKESAIRGTIGYPVGMPLRVPYIVPKSFTKDLVLNMAQKVNKLPYASAHDPSNLRKNLIQQRKDIKLPYNDVPGHEFFNAQSGEDPGPVPWIEFKNFNDMAEYLAKWMNNSDPNIFFQDFNENFTKYADQLIQLTTQKNYTKITEYMKILKNKNFDDLQTLKDMKFSMELSFTSSELNFLSEFWDMILIGYVLGKASQMDSFKKIVSLLKEEKLEIGALQ